MQTTQHLDVTRPVPEPDDDSRPFWEATRRHELTLQRCTSCGRIRFYPRAYCTGCWSPDHAWEPVAGDGTVYAATIVRRAPSPGFARAVPYAVAIVELDEGPRLLSNVVGCEPDEVRIGMPVRLDWEDLDGGTALPVFRPAEDG